MTIARRSAGGDASGRRVLRGRAVGAGLLVGLAVALLPALACLRRKAPHVIVVVVDTLRADRLGAYGETRGLTPFLDELAARGTLFRHAYSTCSWTNPAVASLFTSRYPSQHEVTSYGSRLSDAEVTLAELLAPHRYLTFGFTGNLLLTEPLGFAQGFQTWAVFPRVAKLRADRLRRRALGWADLVRGARSTKPVFLYMQFMDPHAPYDPPPAFRARFERRSDPAVSSAEANRKVLDLHWDDLGPAEIDDLRSLYDAEVAYVDSEIRRLFAGLEERGLLENAIVVVTADHGEELDEHKLMSHGNSLYNQELQVPLILAGAGVPAGRVVADNVSLVDVAPTILELAGLPPEPHFEGRSLVPLLRGEAAPVDVLAQLSPLQPDFDPRRHTAALVRGSHKLLTLAPSWAAALGQAEMYDLAADPHETMPLGYVGGRGPHALAADAPEGMRGELLLAALRRAQTGLAQLPGERTERLPLDPATREKMRALGYVN